MKKVLLSVLITALGEYVEGLSEENLKIGVWQGKVCLRNLVLKRNGLEKFVLPMNVDYGRIDKLELDVPWMSLETQPVKVSLDGLFMICSPINRQTLNTQSLHERIVEQRKSQLARLEASLQKAFETTVRLMQKSKNLDDVSIDAEGEAKQESTYATRLAEKIVDNLEVTVTNIHIRLEDDSTLPSLHVAQANPFSIGMMFKKLSINTTDSNYRPSFETSSTDRYKLLSLTDLCFYWNPSDCHFSEDQLRSCKLEQVMPNCTLLPTSMAIQFHHCQSHYSLKIAFLNELELSMSAAQYDQALALASVMQTNDKWFKMMYHRPIVSVKQNPRVWWKYLFAIVVNRHSPTVSAKDVLEIGRMRRRYIESYASGRNDDVMKLVDDVYEMNVIAVFRNLARREMIQKVKKEILQKRENSIMGKMSRAVFGSSSPTSSQPPTVVTATASPPVVASVSTTSAATPPPKKSWISSMFSRKPAVQEEKEVKQHHVSPTLPTPPPILSTSPTSPSKPTPVAVHETRDTVPSEETDDDISIDTSVGSPKQNRSVSVEFTMSMKFNFGGIAQSCVAMALQLGISDSNQTSVTFQISSACVKDLTDPSTNLVEMSQAEGKSLLNVSIEIPSRGATNVSVDSIPFSLIVKKRCIQDLANFFEGRYSECRNALNNMTKVRKMIIREGVKRVKSAARAYSSSEPDEMMARVKIRVSAPTIIIPSCSSSNLSSGLFINCGMLVVSSEIVNPGVSSWRISLNDISSRINQISMLHPFRIDMTASICANSVVGIAIQPLITTHFDPFIVKELLLMKDYLQETFVRSAPVNIDVDLLSSVGSYVDVDPEDDDSIMEKEEPKKMKITMSIIGIATELVYAQQKDLRLIASDFVMEVLSETDSLKVDLQMNSLSIQDSSSSVRLLSTSSPSSITYSTSENKSVVKARFGALAAKVDPRTIFHFKPYAHALHQYSLGQKHAAESSNAAPKRGLQQSKSVANFEADVKLEALSLEILVERMPIHPFPTCIMSSFGHYSEILNLGFQSKFVRVPVDEAGESLPVLLDKDMRTTLHCLCHARISGISLSASIEDFNLTSSANVGSIVVSSCTEENDNLACHILQSLSVDQSFVTVGLEQSKAAGTLVNVTIAPVVSFLSVSSVMSIIEGMNALQLAVSNVMSKSSQVAKDKNQTSSLKDYLNIRDGDPYKSCLTIRLSSMTSSYPVFSLVLIGGDNIPLECCEGVVLTLACISMEYCRNCRSNNFDAVSRKLVLTSRKWYSISNNASDMHPVVIQDDASYCATSAQVFIVRRLDNIISSLTSKISGRCLIDPISCMGRIESESTLFPDVRSSVGISTTVSDVSISIESDDIEFVAGIAEQAASNKRNQVFQISNVFLEPLLLVDEAKQKEDREEVDEHKIEQGEDSLAKVSEMPSQQLTNYTVRLMASSIKFLLSHDCPLLAFQADELHLNLEGKVYDVNGSMEINKFCWAFYNSGMFSWEYLLEKNSMWVAIGSKNHEEYTVLVKFTDDICLNISQDLMVSLLQFVKEVSQKKRSLVESSSSNIGCLVRNETGDVVTLDGSQTVLSGESCWIVVDSSRPRVTATYSDRAPVSVNLSSSLTQTNKCIIDSSNSPTAVDSNGSCVYNIVSRQQADSKEENEEDFGRPISEQIFENQRYQLFRLNWDEPYIAGDPEKYSHIVNQDTAVDLKKSAYVISKNRLNPMLPATGWRWIDDWHVDMSVGKVGTEIDREGFEYAIDFRTYLLEKRKRVFSPGDVVRRRVLCRNRVRIPLAWDDPRRSLKMSANVSRYIPRLPDIPPQASCFYKIVLMSKICLENLLPVPFSIRLFSKSGCWSGSKELGWNVLPRQKSCVPIILGDATSLSLLPVLGPSNSFEWSEEFDLIESGVAFTSTEVQIKSRAASNMFLKVIRTVDVSTGIVSLKFCPVISINNTLPVDIQVRTLSKNRQYAAFTVPSLESFDVLFSSTSVAPSMQILLPQYSWSESFDLDRMKSDNALSSSIRITSTQSGFATLLVGLMLSEGSVDKYLLTLNVFAPIIFVDKANIGIDIRDTGVGAEGPKRTTLNSLPPVAASSDILGVFRNNVFQNIQSLSSQPMVVSRIEVGAPVYADMLCVWPEFTECTKFLDGCLSIRTAAFDVSSKLVDDYITFTTSEPALLLLLYPIPVTSKWIERNGFFEVHQEVFLKFSNRVKFHYRVYGKQVLPNELVKLGTCSSSYNYLVGIRPSSPALTSQYTLGCCESKKQTFKLSIASCNVWTSGIPICLSSSSSRLKYNDKKVVDVCVKISQVGSLRLCQKVLILPRNVILNSFEECLSLRQVNGQVVLTLHPYQKLIWVWESGENESLMRIQVRVGDGDWSSNAFDPNTIGSCTITQSLSATVVYSAITEDSEFVAILAATREVKSSSRKSSLPNISALLVVSSIQISIVGTVSESRNQVVSAVPDLTASQEGEEKSNRIKKFRTRMEFARIKATDILFHLRRMTISDTEVSNKILFQMHQIEALHFAAISQFPTIFSCKGPNLAKSVKESIKKKWMDDQDNSVILQECVSSVLDPDDAKFISDFGLASAPPTLSKCCKTAAGLVKLLSKGAISIMVDFTDKLSYSSRVVDKLEFRMCPFQIGVDSVLIDNAIEFVTSVFGASAESNSEQSVLAEIRRCQLAQSMKLIPAANLSIIPNDQRPVSSISIQSVYVSQLHGVISFVMTSTPEGLKSSSLGRSLLSSVLFSSLTLEAADVCLDALSVTNSTNSDTASLMKKFVQHYSMQGLTQVLAICGAISLIGSPLSLVSEVGKGIIGVFAEPVKSLSESATPISLVTGVGRGVGGLVTGTITGTVDSAASVLGTANRGLTALTMDESYISRQQSKSQTANSSLLGGIVSGGSSIVGGLVEGVVGLAVLPVQEARKEGVTGFFKGVGMGIIGVAVKPLVGVTSGVVSLAQGVSGSVNQLSGAVLSTPVAVQDESTSEVKRFLPVVTISRMQLSVIEASYFNECLRVLSANISQLLPGIRKMVLESRSSNYMSHASYQLLNESWLHLIVCRDSFSCMQHEVYDEDENISSLDILNLPWRLLSHVSLEWSLESSYPRLFLSFHVTGVSSNDRSAIKKISSIIEGLSVGTSVITVQNDTDGDDQRKEADGKTRKKIGIEYICVNHLRHSSDGKLNSCCIKGFCSLFKFVNQFSGLLATCDPMRNVSNDELLRQLSVLSSNSSVVEGDEFEDDDDVSVRSALSSVSDFTTDGYRFGSANRASQVSTSLISSFFSSSVASVDTTNLTDTASIVGAARQEISQSIGQLRDWQTIDSLAWRLVSRYQASHSGILVPNKCVVLTIANVGLPSSPSLHFRNVELIDGKGYEVIGSVAAGYNEHSRQIVPGGVLVIFCWGLSPSVVSKGRVKLVVNTSAFSVRLGSNHKYLKLTAVGSSAFKSGFAERSIGDNWTKFTIVSIPST